MRLSRFFTLAITLGGLSGLASVASAVPYASSVRNTAGNTWEFVLNETADVVTITRDGGNVQVINNAAVGRHTFDMTNFTDFEISVSKAAPEAWTEISEIANPFTKFELPSGLTVNRDPSSPYFGVTYVVNSRNLPTAAVATPPIPARTMGDGVYALTADRIGVDLGSNFAVVNNADDATQAKAPGWFVDTDPATTPGQRSVYRLSLDEDGNLIVGDWSATAGGLKWASPDLTSGGPLLAIEDGEDAGFPVRNSNGDDLHSRIMSQPTVTGSIGNNLTVTASTACSRPILPPQRQIGGTSGDGTLAIMMQRPWAATTASAKAPRRTSSSLN